VASAANKLKLNQGTFRNRLRVAKSLYGLEPDWSLQVSAVDLEEGPNAFPTASAAKVFSKIDHTVVSILKGAALTLEQIALDAGMSRGAALDSIDALAHVGYNVRRIGDKYVIDDAMEPAFITNDRMKYESTKDNEYRFGVVADSHLGSKYERLDCLNDIYDQFVKKGVTKVFHCGNWIDGEARFNRTSLLVHGMDAQLEYFVENYPQRSGITTYAVTGDDHEGWYAQREGIDIGRRLERDMRDAGRNDWVNLGYMEAFVDLVNANTGKSSILSVNHPGGGSSYAISYVVQKIIESLEGGEKPAVALYGHYHKSGCFNIRNVWAILVPSTKDQDVWMRGKRISSVVGGGIVDLEQDPETGAIISCAPNLRQYFNKGYYNGRWSHSSDVVLPKRGIL
jgi:hypothetical protein